MQSNDLSASECRVYYDDFGASNHSSGCCLDGSDIPHFSLHSFLPSPEKSWIFCLCLGRKNRQNPSKRIMREEKIRERIPID